MNTHDTLYRLDIVWKALADPHRRGILAILGEGPCSAGELARAVGLAPNAASFHLRYLLSADLLAVERRGRSLLYRLDRQRLAAWRAEAEGLTGGLNVPTEPPPPPEPSRQSSRHQRSPTPEQGTESRIELELL